MYHAAALREGHGGGIGGQPFFVEGVREALDVKGEYWVDAATDTLYILPNTTATDSESEVRFELYFQPYLRSISA